MMNSADSTPDAPKLAAPRSPVTIQSLSQESGTVPIFPQAPGTGAVPAASPSGAVKTVTVAAEGPKPFIADLPPDDGKKPGLIATYWKKVGGGSLIISILVHVGLIIAAMLAVQSTFMQEKPVDFLPGGGNKAGQEASQALSQNVQMKKRSLLNKTTPMSKIVSKANAAISLPDTPMDSLDVPEMSSVMGGGVMGSAGFGSGGAGGGFGTGQGIGGAKGVTFKPIIMFGREIKARKIAVIMDVSGSMTPHLTKVIKELDRVASGSRVILYVGCGVATPKDGVRLDKDAIKTSSKAKQEDKNFEIFWRRSHGRPRPPGSPPPDAKEKEMEMKGPVPEEEVYAVMANRAETYFMKSQGIQYAWIALLARELHEDDALYWFSDFQDQVDDDQLEAVLKNLKRRKQKLFIHASGKGKSFEKVRDSLAIPSGGEVIEPEKETPKPTTPPKK